MGITEFVFELSNLKHQRVLLTIFRCMVNIITKSVAKYLVYRMTNVLFFSLFVN